MRQILALSLLVGASLAMTGCNRPCEPTCEVIDETYMHRYGVAIPAEEWTEGGQHGQIISSYNTGIVTTQSYVAGVLEGETTHTFPHSDTIESVQVYSKNQLVKDTLHYPQGVPKQETHYTPEGGQMVTQFYDNGQTMSIEYYDPAELLLQGQYFDKKKNQVSQVENSHGIRTNYDQYGLLQSKETIENGVMTSRTVYHPNGAPREVVTYRNGEVDGVRKTYLPGGEPNTIEQWVRGQQTGLTTVFQHGEKYAEIPYVNGQKEGVERRYRDGGKTLVEEVSWSKDKLNGPSITYLGSTKQITYFINDIMLSQRMKPHSDSSEQ